jgi:hypothetical protein
MSLLALNSAPVSFESSSTPPLSLDRRREAFRQPAKAALSAPPSTSDQRVHQVMQAIHSRASDDDEGNDSAFGHPVSIAAVRKQEALEPSLFGASPPVQSWKEAFETPASLAPFVPESDASSPPPSSFPSSSSLMDKLNYVIHLLEEQQQEATQTVTEELVLYSFVGVFVIFVVDRFAQCSRYVR